MQGGSRQEVLRDEAPAAPVDAAAPALAPAPQQVLALQRSAGNQAVVALLSSAPTASLQRTAFTLGRNSKLDNIPQRQLAIDHQNKLIRRITELYVPMDMSGAGPYVAFALQVEGDLVEASIKEPRLPRDNDFVDSWRVRFQSEHFAFDVELVSDPNADPAFGGSNADVMRAVEDRLSPPYDISKVTARGGGGAMGRTYANAQWWAVNPSFTGIVSPVGSAPMEQRPATEFEQLAKEHFGLQPERHLSKAPTPAALTPLPARSDMPFVIYADLSGPGGPPPTARKEIDPDIFERDFTRSMEVDDKGWMEQTAISKPPAENRKTGGRDPNTEMGVSAWAPVGGQTAPMKGKLATHEWCHLVGDGDSGKCAPENLYIGTNHVNTEQLAMENALRPHRLYYGKLGWGIQIDAQAIVEEVLHQGKTYLRAVWVKYEINLVKTGKPRIEIIRHHMDAQRGIVPEQEYKALSFHLDQRLTAARDTVTEVESFKPAPFSFM